MKKDKESNLMIFWRRWPQSPGFLRDFLVFLLFFILFIFCLILTWKQYKDNLLSQPRAVIPSSCVDQKVEEPTLPAAPSPLSAPIPPDLNTLNDHTILSEQKDSQQPQASGIPRRLIAFELFRGALEGLVGIEALKIFLQKTPEPWAASLLNALLPLNEIKSYSQLESLLVLPSSSQLSSIWQRLQKKIKSFIRVRKLDKKGEYNLGQLEDIKNFLRAHDIQKALESFERLSPEEQMHLSSWKKWAQDRFFLETSTKNLLLELTES